MGGLLRQSTAAARPFGPFLDKTDGVTLEVAAGIITSIDHATTGIFLSKNGATGVIRHQAVTASVLDAYGMFLITLDTTDTDTLGHLRVMMAEAATFLPVWDDYTVIPQALWDTLFVAQPCVAINKFFDKAVPTGTVNSLPDAVAGAANGLAIIDATGVKLTKTVDLTAGQSIACNDKTGFSLSATGADLILKTSTFVVAIAAAINELATYGLTALNTLLVTTGIKTATTAAPADMATATNQTSILSKLLKYVQLLSRKDAAIATDNATELTAINASGGSGAGAYSNQTDGQEALRDRGDAAWITAAGFSTHSAADAGNDAASKVLVTPAQKIVTDANGKVTYSNADPPTAAANADAVWDEALAGHSGVGSAGAALSAAGTAGDPWIADLPGAYAPGTAGSVLGNIPETLVTVDDHVLSRSSHSAADIWTVASRTLTTFGSLISDIAAAVWSYTVRTFTGVSGSISYAVLSGKVRDDYITALGHLVGGEMPLGETERIFAINAALKKYSGHRPRIVTEDEDGTGGFDYLLALLADWTDGFSTIKSVEYPVDDTDETAAILQEDAWQIYQKPTGKVLRFLADTPAATEDIRITYTTLHVCTDAACTVPSYDEEALQILAASIFCDMLAAYFAQTQDSTIQADSVDHKSKASEYAARARAYRKMYFDHLGIKEGETPAASVTRDQDMAGSWGDRATHPRKYR